jgi:hypothetical protein
LTCRKGCRYAPPSAASTPTTRTPRTATISGLDPNNPDPKDWLGKKVEMYTEKVYSDKEGNDVIAYKFRPAGTG